MSRPRKRLKPLVRQVPQTAGIAPTWSCGHQTKERIRLSLYGDYTQEMKEKVEVEKLEWISQALENTCPDCIANNQVEDIRVAYKKITDFLGIEELPSLEGSARMKSFAESIRQGLFNAEINNITSDVINSLRVQSLIDQVLISTLKSTWGAKVASSDSKDITELANEYNLLPRDNRFRNMAGPASEVEALAIWLLMRFRLSEYSFLRQESSAKLWIALSRLRHGSPTLSVRTIPSHIYLSAIVVAQTNCWDDRQSAWNAFQTFCEPTSKPISEFFDKRMQGEPASLKDILAETRVIKALSPAPQLSIW